MQQDKMPPMAPQAQPDKAKADNKPSFPELLSGVNDGLEMIRGQVEEVLPDEQLLARIDELLKNYQMLVADLAKVASGGESPAPQGPPGGMTPANAGKGVPVQ